MSYVGVIGIVIRASKGAASGGTSVFDCRFRPTPLRLFSKFGFDEGVAGHITARDPEHKDCFWVNPYATPFSQIKVSNLSLISHEGEAKVGKPCNAAAFAIHSRVHMARPDVAAAAHAHAVYGKSWSSLGRLLDPLTQDACMFYKDHSVFHEYNGSVYDTEEGDRIGRALVTRRQLGTPFLLETKSA